LTEPEVIVLADAAAVASEAAERIAMTLSGAVRERGRADWATTGGSMAPAIYRRLAADPLRDDIPWSSVQVWWGDDRYVPRDHPLSNVKPLDDILLALGHTEAGQVGLGTAAAPRPVPLPHGNLHPFPTSAAIGGAHGAAWCAARLADELRSAGPGLVDDRPVFDLVVLGIGADGHVLSVFPGSEAFDSDRLALAVPAPTHIEPYVERVTLHPAVLSIARSILVVAGGEAKAAVVRDALQGEGDPRQLPARLARTGAATWIVDAAAGSELEPPQPDRQGGQAHGQQGGRAS
jgi:6-phosphogluconolactonase